VNDPKLTSRCFGLCTEFRNSGHFLSIIFKPLFAYAVPGAHPSIVANRRGSDHDLGTLILERFAPQSAVPGVCLGVTSLLRLPAQAGPAISLPRYPHIQPAKREIT
jgi:hypothetical protein